MRPAVVVFDPALAASQPVPELAASALNALGHAVEGPCTVRANPVATLAAHEAARLLGGRLVAAPSPTATRSRSARCWPATRSTRPASGCTTCSPRRSSASPASATAPPTRRCCRTRSARWPGASRTGSRRSAIRPQLAAAIRARTGAGGLRDLGVDRAVLPECADAAAARPQLANTPPAADRAEILALYESAL